MSWLIAEGSGRIDMKGAVNPPFLQHRSGAMIRQFRLRPFRLFIQPV